MANSSNKKIATGNQTFLSLALKAMAIGNAFAIAWLFLITRLPALGWEWVPYYTSMGTLLVLYRILWSIGAPFKGVSGKVEVTVDLYGPGLHQYVFDAFVVILAAQTLSLVSVKSWFLLLIIPGYATYRLARLIKSYLF